MFDNWSELKTAKNVNYVQTETTLYSEKETNKQI